MGRVTIRDVARKLNLSTSTVSIALSDKYGVNSETKAQIVVAALEMGYDLSKIRKRAMTNPKTIKVIVRDRSFLSTPFWSEIIQGIEVECSNQNYHIDVFAFDISNGISREDLKLLNGGSAGLLFIDGRAKNDYSLIRELGIPVVLIDPRSYSGGDFSQVAANNFSCGSNVCRYLISKGHRHLAFLGNIEHSQSIKMRYLGFSETCADFSDEYGVILQSITGVDGGDVAWMHSEKKLIKVFSNKNRPTALFCGNDAIALSAVRAINKECGLCCPDDVSVFGFDNIAESALNNPPLTTIDIDKKEMGATAVRLLLEEAQNVRFVKKSIEIQGKIVERCSVKEIKI